MSWLPEKRLEVKRSTFVDYSEICKAHVEEAEIGKKLLCEIDDWDLNLWKLEIDGKRTPNKRPTKYDKLLLDVRSFKHEENEDEVNPFTEAEVESLLSTLAGMALSLLAVFF